MALLLTRVVSLTRGLVFGFGHLLLGRVDEHLLKLGVFLEKRFKRRDAPSRFPRVIGEQHRLLDGERQQLEQQRAQLGDDAADVAVVQVE